MKPRPTRTQLLLEHLLNLNGPPPAVKIGDPVIAVDTREQRPYVFGRSVPMVVKCLPAGDMAPLGAESRCAIDRKALGDFVRCITVDRERFARELAKLATYETAAIVVEANLSDVMRRKYRAQVDPQVVIGAAASIFVRYRVPVFFCGDRYSGSDFSLRVLRKFWEQKMKDTPAEVANG